MAMEFWGAEVKSGETLKVKPEEGKILHLSQAALGESKKDKNESVLLSVTVDEKKIVLGTLSATGCPQIAYDLIFEKDFELSHNWKNGSVHFIGYMAEVQEEESEDEEMGFDESDSEEVEEDLPVAAAADNGKAEPKTEKAKATVEKAKADKVENAAAKKGKDVKPVEDSDDSDDSDDSEEDDSDDKMQDMVPAEGDSDEFDDDDDSSEEEDTPTPKNAKQGKKRSAEVKTPVPEKKAKIVTPQKSGGDGKKGASTHTATPHPKKGAKTAEKSGSKPQTPKSAGTVTCKACSKSFNYDGALQSHTKAKHSDAK